MLIQATKVGFSFVREKLTNKCTKIKPFFYDFRFPLIEDRRPIEKLLYLWNRIRTKGKVT
jgi:hypothetical protein